MNRILSLLLSISLLAGLCACSGGYQAGMEFTYALPQNVDTLDPQTASRQSSFQVIGSIFQGLCGIDDQGEVIPGAARKWDVNENSTRFTFHLYGDAKWSNGAPVTADDFLFAIQRALRPETATPSVDDLFVIQGARAVYNGEADQSALGVYAQDERTLVVDLERSYPDFPALTAGTHYMPCNREFFEDCSGHYGLSAEYLITNGPFTFESEYSWVTDPGKRQMTLVPSDNYRAREDVTPKSLTYLIDYDSSITEDPVSALLEGKIDIATLPETAAEDAAGRGCGVQVLDDAVTGLLFNADSGILKYPQAREIFTKLIDRQDLLDRRMDKNSQEAMGIMANCVHWNGESYYSGGAPMFTQRDDSVIETLLPSLLTRSGEERMPNITIICPNDEESINIANGLLVSWNSSLGSAYNIEPLEDSSFQSRISGGEYQAALYTLRAGGTTPYQVLKAFESSSTPSLYRDQQYDSQLHSMTFELSAYQSLETYLMEHYIFYPLFSDKTYYISSPSSQGISASPDLLIDFSRAKKSE